MNTALTPDTHKNLLAKIATIGFGADISDTEYSERVFALW